MSQHVFSCDRVGQEYAVEVYVDDFLPLGISHFISRSVDADSCVGVAEIESAKLRDYLVDHCLNVSLVRNVALYCNDLPACCLCNFLRGLLSFVNVKIDNGNVRSCFGKSRSSTLSDSSCSAGNETFFTVEAHFLNDSQF